MVRRGLLAREARQGNMERSVLLDGPVRREILEILDILATRDLLAHKVFLERLSTLVRRGRLVGLARLV